MISFLKKDLLVFWRDRKEVLISLLGPILIIIVVNFAFSGITFDDAGDREIHAGLVLEDDGEAGLQQFADTLQTMDIPAMEIENMMEMAAALSPGEEMVSFFDNPEIRDWILTHELGEEKAIEQVENGDLDAIVKIPAGFTYDVLAHVMLDQPADTAMLFQIEAQSIETDILTRIIDNYMETLNFQFALGAVTEGDAGAQTLPQGGREIINQGASEVDLAQYFTVAMATLFALFIASTVATKTETEKRERVFNRILLTNNKPVSYLMGKIISTFCMVWLQLMLVFLATDLLLGIFPEKSTAFWLSIIVIVTFFSVTVAGLSAIFTSLMLRANNINLASGLFTMVIMLIAALGGNFFPLEGSPGWLQAMAEWTPTGITVSMFTELLQYGEFVSIELLMKQSGFFILFLLIGILLFPERGRA